MSGPDATAAALPRIYLVRHGQTSWSLSGQHTSRTDLALTPAGEDDACGLGARLADVTFAHAFSSPLRRARRTAELAGWGARLEIDPDLVEWDYGEYEGLRTSEIVAIRPDWNLFRDGAPGGESPVAVGARADRVLVRLRALSGNIVICTHGHFGRVLGACWIGLGAAGAEHLLFDTGSVSVLGHDHGRADQPAIARWNAGA